MILSIHLSSYSYFKTNCGVTVLARICSQRECLEGSDGPVTMSLHITGQDRFHRASNGGNQSSNWGSQHLTLGAWWESWEGLGCQMTLLLHIHGPRHCHKTCEVTVIATPMGCRQKYGRTETFYSLFIVSLTFFQKGRGQQNATCMRMNIFI